MLHASLLGKEAAYPSRYAPELLFPVSRRVGRDALGLAAPLPFDGVDLWTGYEVSWCNRRGKPQVAVLELRVPATSEHLIESKSLKLYLNSLNAARFDDLAAVEACLRRDLAAAAGATVDVRLLPPAGFAATTCELPGDNLDTLDIDFDAYAVDPSLLRADGPVVQETLRSDLLKSNCPVTGQPDWASMMIRYSGPRIDRAGLLRYIVSYRDHSGFHEQCVEGIFAHVRARCRTERLTVYARYTRRGGLDINPFRSDFEAPPANARTFRQ
jgi:7-cyano-7-deazaguanine reductase